MKKILLLLITLTLSACITYHPSLDVTPHPDTVKKGEYLREIDFDFDSGLEFPIINVTIDNEQYRFLYDTGAPTIISEEIFKKINAKVEFHSNVTDANDNTKEIKGIQLDNISIADIDFGSSKVLVHNMKNGPMSCMNIDGILGNNQIKTHFWKIDYQNKKMSFTNNLENLKIPQDSHALMFNVGRIDRLSYMTLKVNNEKIKDVVFDTGSSGGINIQSLKNLNKDKTIEILGSGTVSAFGYGKNSKNYVSIVDETTLGKLKLKNLKLGINENGFQTIGNDFLKNFMVYINYRDNVVNLVQQKEPNNIYKSFGFTPKIDNDTLQVASIILGSTLDKRGIKIGDEIIDINGIKSNKVVGSCAIWLNLRKSFKNQKNMTVTIKNNNELKTISLENKVLLQ